MIDGYLWEGILRYPEINRLKVLWLLATTLPRYGLFRLHILGGARFRAGWVRGLAGLLRGWRQEEIDRLFTWLANEYLLPFYREDVIAYVHQHKAAGQQVILLSTFFEEAAAKVADHLGADHAIGTRLAYKDNKATGRLSGKACVGSRKIDFVRQYLGPTSLSRCIGYADSYTDAPLLAAMGQAVAVYPDAMLNSVATEQGWPIHS